MEIFYLRKEEFLKSIDKTSLKHFCDGRSYLSDEKYLEHLCGLFLVKFIAKHIYGVKNVDIILKGDKPIFKSSGIHFSISHSNDIVLVAFNNAPIGVDIEYMRQRNYQKIMERYGEIVKNPAREQFYKFWTVHEAEIKLGEEIKSLFSLFLEENYVLSCVSSNTMVTNFKIKRLDTTTDEPIDLECEFETPKKIKFK